MGALKIGAAFAAAVTAAVAVAAPAAAEPYFTFDGTQGVFGHDSIGAGSFTDTFTFNLPTSGSADSTITSIASFVGSANDVNFTSVTLNGTAFDVAMTGKTEFRFLGSLPVTSGLQTLVVNGTSTRLGSYSGTLAFAAGVPEPATWAMMIGGFGLVGGVMRRRARKVSVSFA